MKTLSVTLKSGLVNFNENETKVIIALYSEVLECTGGEFGYALDARPTDLTRHQFAGYLSALSLKGIFDYLDDDYSTTYGGQFALVPELQSILEKKIS